MRWRKIAFWSLTGVAALLVLVLSWLWVGDLGVIKPYVERWVTDYTGREFRINGELSIDLGQRLFIVADDVTFANAEWAADDNMVSVGRIDVELITSSLFGSRVIVEMLSISNARISLEESKDSAANWELDLPESDTVEEDDADSSTDVLLREATIQNLELVYVSPEREGPVELVVSALNQHLRDDDFLDLDIKGTLSGREFEVESESGTWSALLAGKDVRFNFEGRFDTLTISSEGLIDDLYAPVSPTLSFSAQGPAIDDLTSMLALGQEGEGDISLSGTLAPRAENLMLLSLTGNVGQTSIETRAEFENLANFSYIDANINASGPDLGRILAIAGIEGIRKAPFLLVADINRDDAQVSVPKAEMVFGDTRFMMTADLPQFPALDDASATLNVKGPDLARLRYLTGLPGTATGAFSIDMSLAADPDQREYYELAITTSHGSVMASGEIRGGDTYLGSTARLDAEILDLASFASSWKLDIGDLPADALKANGDLEYIDGAIRLTSPLTVSLGPSTISADGHIALTDDLAGTDLLIEIASDQLRYLTRPFTDTPFVPPESISLSTRLLVEPGSYRFTDLRGLLGNDAIEGDATIILAPGIAGSSVRFAVSGDKTEELLADVPDLKIRPGPFEISGRLGFAEDALTAENLRLKRPDSELTGGLTLGLPAERRWVRFDFQGDSENIHGLIEQIGDFSLADQPFTLNLGGLLNGDALDIEALDLTMGDATVSASGLLDIGDKPENTRFSIDVDVPDMSRLGKLGERGLARQRFAIAATIEGNETQVLVDDLRATLGGSTANGMIFYRTGDRPFLEIDISSDRLVFEPFLEPVENPDYDHEPEFEDGRLIPDVPIPFDALNALDARFEVDVLEFGRGRLRLSEVSVDAVLKDGILELNDFGFRAASGYLRASARLDPADGEGLADIKVMARDLALGVSDSNQDLSSRGDIDINLRFSGNDLRSQLANSNGIFFVRATGGKLKNNRFMQMLYGDLLDEIVSTVNPFAKTDDVTIIECIVAPIRLVDGQLASEPQTFLRTDKINLSARTDINLETERLDLGIQTSPRKILSISAAELVNSYVKVVGTMAKPALAVDEQGVLITGGAAVATGGLSIVAKAAWSRLSRVGDPCQTTLEKSVEAMAPDFPDLEPFPEASVATQ